MLVTIYLLYVSSNASIKSFGNSQELHVVLLNDPKIDFNHQINNKKF